MGTRPARPLLVEGEPMRGKIRTSLGRYVVRRPHRADGVPRLRESVRSPPVSPPRGDSESCTNSPEIPLNAVTPVTPVDYFGALAALPPPPEMVYNRLLALLGRFSSLFSCLLGLLAASCLAQALQEVKKRPPGSMFGCRFATKNRIFCSCFGASRASLCSTFL